MKNKIVLNKHQVEMIENHRNRFELLINKRRMEDYPSSIDNLTLDEVASAFFDGYKIEQEWYESEDVLIFEEEDNYINFKSNRKSWKDAKDISNKPLYVSVKDFKDHVSFGMSLEEMIKLHNYLAQKIDYLQG